MQACICNLSHKAFLVSSARRDSNVANSFAGSAAEQAKFIYLEYSGYVLCLSTGGAPNLHSTSELPRF